MRNDELLIACGIVIVLLLLFGQQHANDQRPLGFDKETTSFLRSILDQYVTKLIFASNDKQQQQSKISEL